MVEEIEHLFPGLQPPELQHLLDDDFGGRVIRRELFGLLILSRERKNESEGRSQT